MFAGRRFWKKKNDSRGALIEKKIVCRGKLLIPSLQILPHIAQHEAIHTDLLQQYIF